MLPCGDCVELDRGAEQGDPEGSFKSSAFLAQACGRASASFEREQGLPPGGGAASWWYIDDGRLYVRPELLDAWLVALDRELALVGATRVATDGKVKSSVRLLGDPTRGRDTTFAWAGPHTRRTCTRLLDGDEVDYLGASLGSDRGGELDFEAAQAKARALREVLPQMGARGH